MSAPRLLAVTAQIIAAVAAGLLLTPIYSRHSAMSRKKEEVGTHGGNACMRSSA